MNIHYRFLVVRLRQMWNCGQVITFFFFVLCISDEDLEKFIADVLKASSKGVSALRNATSEPNWNFGQALFFSTTVVTTIGAYFYLAIFR